MQQQQQSTSSSAAVSVPRPACIPRKIRTVSQACLYAAMIGSATAMREIMVAAKENARKSGLPPPVWGSEIAAAAAARGHLECLQVATQNECALDGSVCAEAAGRGHLSCLAFLHSTGYGGWDEDTPRAAAAWGHTECLAFALAHGCAWNPRLVCIAAASGGFLQTLTLAVETPTTIMTQGVISHTALVVAARGGHLDCLTYLHERGWPWSAEVCAWAASAGRLDCLAYAHDRGCPWDARTSAWAARNGHLHCLVYAHHQGCPWDDRTPGWAALGAHPDCLVYALANGCPADEETAMEDAEEGGDAECLDHVLQYFRILRDEEDGGQYVVCGDAAAAVVR